MKLTIETKKVDLLFDRLAVWQNYIYKESKGSAAVQIKKKDNKIELEVSFVAENVIFRAILKRELKSKIKKIDPEAKVT